MQPVYSIPPAKHHPHRFTLTGSYVSAAGGASPLLVHVAAATSAEDAREQMRAVLPLSNVLLVFPGHIHTVLGEADPWTLEDGLLRARDGQVIARSEEHGQDEVRPGELARPKSRA